MVSSTLVFSGVPDENVDITHLGAYKPSSRKIGYSTSKLVMHNLINMYRELGCNIVTIIPPGIYGPYDNFKETHLVAALVKRFVDNKESTVTLSLNSQAKLQLLYNGDLAKIVMHFLESDDITGDYIIAPDPVSVSELVNAIKHITGFRGSVMYTLPEARSQVFTPTVTWSYSDMYVCLSEMIKDFRKKQNVNN
jgi:nucleoside-diphosphate-sugar epimerase